MRLLATLICWMLLLLPVVIIAVILVMVDERPLLSQGVNLSPAQIERGKKVLDDLMQPPHKASGSKALMLAERDVSEALNAASQHYFHLPATLSVANQQAIVKMTLTLPANPFGRYLNFEWVLRETEQLPALQQLTLGQLAIPGAWLAFAMRYLSLDEQWTAYEMSLRQSLQRVQFQDHSVLLSYQWQPGLVAQISNNWLSDADKARIERYQKRLAESLPSDKGGLSMATLLQSLFAVSPPSKDEAQVVAENRAALLVLTLYINQRTLDKVIPQAKHWPKAPWRSVILQGREDLAKHYSISACLAVYAGTPLADAVGLFKEVSDSQGGSGFSFRDLMADRAGTRLGEAAIAMGAKAGKVQRLLASATEADIMPASAHLQESMTEAVFNRLYGGIQGDAYQKTVSDIDRRIAALPIHQP